MGVALKLCLGGSRAVENLLSTSISVSGKKVSHGITGDDRAAGDGEPVPLTTQSRRQKAGGAC